MNTEIKVYTLGKLLIQRNGEVLENFITTKASLLFTYLALNPGEHARKKLAFMFWSETNDKQALKNLRTVLSSLRQQIDAGLDISNDGLAINPDQAAIEVDASAFENGCNRIFASRSPATLDVFQSMQDLASLYQGDFLKNITVRDAVELDDWITEKQRHFHQLYIRLLFEIVEVAEKQGNYEAGLQYAWKLVTLDPLWDDAQRQLMRLLTYTKRSNEALLQYEAFVRLLAAELQSEPEAETTTLYEQIRAKQFKPPPIAGKSSIVLPDTPFIEPAEDVELAQRMLNTPPCHLLTIYGISGVGKTSLVTRIAFHRQHLYPDGVYFISLKSTQAAYDLPFAIASVLGIDMGNPIDRHLLEDSIIENIRHRRLLLVLDNYEHLLPDTDFVERILEAATQLQMLITSQAPLNLFREWLLPLNGLRFPSSEDKNPEIYEAVRLFELTAQRINPRFNLQAEITGVVKICQLVDGLPLALTIAAGWTRILPISKIIEYIVEGQEFQLPFQKDLPTRHQSLEMMLEYTWNTLTASEQYALTSLSIFNTAFDLEEADQICTVDVNILTLLIQKSLIQKFGDKYRMHQLVLGYARRKLVYSDQKELLPMLYLDYFTRVLRSHQQQKLPLHEYLLAIEKLYASISNYKWMSKFFQPLYLLNISRFLMIYWEISRADMIPTIRQLFEAIEQHDLPPDVSSFLNIQIARLYLHSQQYEQAYHYLGLALQNDPIKSLWADMCLVFNVYGLVLHLLKLTDPLALDEMERNEAYILRKTQLTLSLLYLDMCDYQSAEDVFIYLLETPLLPIESALIWAARGSIAAETQNYTASAEHFIKALACLESVDAPALKLALNTLLLRIGSVQN